MLFCLHQLNISQKYKNIFLLISDKLCRTKIAPESSLKHILIKFNLFGEHLQREHFICRLHFRRYVFILLSFAPEIKHKFTFEDEN